MGRPNTLMCTGKASDFCSKDAKAWTNPESQVEEATKFFTVAPSTCGTTAWNVMSPFWILEFWHRSCVFGKSVYPWKCLFRILVGLSASLIEDRRSPQSLQGEAFTLHRSGTPPKFYVIFRPRNWQIPAAAHLLGLRVGIPPAAWMSVYCEFCLLWGLCD